MELFTIIVTALIAFVLFLAYHLVVPNRKINDGNIGESDWVTEKKFDPYEDIEPLPLAFEWSSTPTIKIRPFKPRYHLTMGLENLPLSELVQVDYTYIDRIRLRRSLMDEHPLATRQCNPVAEPALYELYEWIFSTYLPKRFPSMYKLSSSNQLHNLVTNRLIPLHPTSPISALETLGENVDTDFLILLPTSTLEDGTPIYHLQAFVTCFPSGFSTREKCGKPLASIHSPVPGYATKLAKSMDRFFAKLEVGKVVKRANWSITTNDKLYAESGNHLYGDDKGEKPVPQQKNAKTLDPSGSGLDAEIERQKAEVVVEDCRLRCERQTLHRLPKTQALVFAFKTYLYTLNEVKEEGSGPALADAIEGLEKGSVPDMAFYKRGVVWGEKVVEFLRR